MDTSEIFLKQVPPGKKAVTRTVVISDDGIREIEPRTEGSGKGLSIAVGDEFFRSISK